MKQYYVLGGHITEYMVAYAIIISWEDGNYKYEYFIRSATETPRIGGRTAAVQEAIERALNIVSRLTYKDTLPADVHQFSRFKLAKYDANLTLEYHIQEVIQDYIDPTEGEKEDV